MLDRHQIHTLHQAGYSIRQIAREVAIAVSTVQRILKEPPVTTSDDTAARRARGVGRPRRTTLLVPTLTTWLAAEPRLNGRAALRRLREHGTRVTTATFYRAWREARGAVPSTAPLLGRFEGVPAEFAQFDFGETDVRLTEGTTHRVHFAWYRLKYSRWMYVQVVPDQKVESLVRALLNGFASADGVPLRVVFDRPRTVVTGQTADGLPKWPPTLQQVAIDYHFTIELCAPRRGNQKGSVEALVKYVKRDCFEQRRFTDLLDDLPAQLLEWLTDVNTLRPSRATGVVPAERLAQEPPRFKALALAPDAYGLRFPVFVGPTGMVEFRGVRYAMPPAACSQPATLTLYPDRVHLVTANGKHTATHPRFPEHGVSYLPGQRAAQLARVAGARGQLYFKRERLLELGELAASYLTELVHARLVVWPGDVERLYTLLEELGEARFLAVLKRAFFQRLFGAEFVVDLAAGRTIPICRPSRPTDTAGTARRSR